MNMQKIPANIKSIITAIDDELQEEFKKFVIKDNEIVIDKQINIFLELISTLLQYYFASLYKRVFTYNPSDDVTHIYNEKINNFINVLTTALYTCINKNIYNEILEQIVVFIINIYIDLQIEKSDDNTTVYILPINDVNLLINNVNELSKFRNKIDILNSSIIFANKFENITLNNISFKNVPVGLSSFINTTIIRINPDLVTNKNIVFINSNEIEYKEDIEVFINYSTSLKILEYNIIYALIKDKLLAVCDSNYWQQQFSRATSNTYVADECSHVHRYLYNMRAEIDYKEYFLSCVIAFIADNEILRIIDFNNWKYISNLINSVMKTRL